MEQILAALRQLDPLNDEHWTASGDPRIDAVKALSGQDVEVDRQIIVNAAPDFSRTSAANPESLLMNQKKVVADEEQPEEIALVEEFTGDSDDALSELMGKHSGIANELLFKSLIDCDVLGAQEMSVLLGSMSAADHDLYLLVLANIQEKIRVALEAGQKAMGGFRWMESIVKKSLNIARPEQSNQDAIRCYLEAQNQNRIDAAEKQRTILKNLNVSDLSPLSKLDQAMSRKTGRGNQRPKF